MRFTTFFFDLDETLYPHNNGLWEEIRARINAFLHERMGFPLDQIESLREKYFNEYGTTLRGLQAHHQVDMDEYLAFVHDVPVHRYLSPIRTCAGPSRGCPSKNTSSPMPIPITPGGFWRWSVCRGFSMGSLMCTSLLHICKPMPEAFELALKAAGSPDPHACVLLDDQRRITRAARSLGMFTVLVGEEDPGEDADAALLHLAGLPGLFDGRI